MVKKSKIQALQNVWYLDSCVFHYLINNKNLFIEKLWLKYFNFTTAIGLILWAKSIRTIVILLVDGSLLKLRNVTYTLDYNSNLIFLGQHYDSNIIYVDISKTITLIQSDQLITYLKCDQNLFILDLITSNKAIQIIKRGQFTHLVSKNKKVMVWYWNFDHASNAKIIRALKLFIKIGDFNSAYNPTKVYSNFK